MNKQTIIELIKKEKPYLNQQFGLKDIALFGSYARGEENPNSDIDLLVSLQKPSFSLLMGLCVYLEEKVNAKIDVTRIGPHLSERFLKMISKDLIYV